MDFCGTDRFCPLKGTYAVGILLLLLNILFLLAMVVKVVRAGSADIQKVRKWLQMQSTADSTKVSSCETLLATQ